MIYGLGRLGTMGWLWLTHYLAAMQRNILKPLEGKSLIPDFLTSSMHMLGMIACDAKSFW